MSMETDGKRLAGKVAWVQGGAGAVGAAVARELAAAGAYVVVSGRDAGRLDAVMAPVHAAGSGEALVCDVGDAAAVSAAVARIEGERGRIDIVVNSAGVNPTKRHFHDMSFQEWDNSVRVNLSGMFYVCKAVLPGMRARHDGVIVNIASWAGRFAAYFAGPAYSSTKRAVLALTESINMEDCIHGIRATCISPAGIDTPLLDKRPIPPSPEMRASLLKPGDIADVTRYICELPAHVCMNEILMSPTLNLAYLGELETRRRP